MTNKDIKFLYETTLPKIVEEPTVEIREEDGQKIEVKKIVKKIKQVKTAILKPDRKLFKAAEIFYAKSLAEYLKAGLLPYSLVAKRYANDGGPLTEKEKERIKELQSQSRELEESFFGITETDDEQKKKKNELLVKINAVNVELGNIQNSYSDIFESTAEMKARSDTIEWWSLFLLYINEDDKGYKPVFSNGFYDERIDKLEDYEDKADKFYVELIKRMSYLVSFWFTARDAVTSIDFNTMEKLYVDTISNYKIEEPKEEIKVTDKTETAEQPK